MANIALKNVPVSYQLAKISIIKNATIHCHIHLTPEHQAVPLNKLLQHQQLGAELSSTESTLI